ncbi:hypothetical protein QFC22_002421 [Naganishia vaughanmartiniae]|uniref:Uncharacterized protein n=1 Tax=Naganishia vaughanmartiniae TaxID=1424756 RepID=A0ACC2XDC9_9TREE|nr:hypothetical protein QFC22_002421 [Naganishia vaughanmartiniae]
MTQATTQADPVIDLFSDEWQDFFQSDAYLAWYGQALANGSLDNLNCDSDPPNLDPVRLCTEPQPMPGGQGVTYYDSDSDSDSGSEDMEDHLVDKSITGDDHPDADGAAAQLAVDVRFEKA